ncbi:hypothetical protein Dimus_023072, partial [Dionaea muscipula]
NDDNNANWMDPHDLELDAFGTIGNEDMTWTRGNYEDIEMPLNDTNAHEMDLHEI